jgi:hypothetical protein
VDCSSWWTGDGLLSWLMLYSFAWPIFCSSFYVILSSSWFSSVLSFAPHVHLVNASTV